MDETILIETERLILRKFVIDDADQIFNNYANNDNVTKYLSWTSHKTVDDTKSFLTGFVLPAYKEDNTYRWAIVLKQTNEVIGSIDTVSLNTRMKRAELGWVIGETYWGQGFMPEAAKAVIDYLFTKGFVRIEASHYVENTKSGRVMQKVGMKHEGTLRRYLFNNQGNLVDAEIYSIVK